MKKIVSMAMGLLVTAGFAMGQAKQADSPQASNSIEEVSGAKMQVEQQARRNNLSTRVDYPKSVIRHAESVSD